MKSLFAAVLIVAYISVHAGPLLAHTNDAIDVAAAIFKYPFGARTYGMGRTGVADVGDPSNLFFNPANLATVRGVLFTASKNLTPVGGEASWIINGGVSGGYQTTLGRSAGIGFGGDVRFGRLEYGPITWTDDRMYRETSFEGNENYFGLSAAGGMLISDLVHVGLGTTLKYWWADYAPDVATVDRGVNTVVFDMGFRVAANLFEESGFLLVPAVGVGYVNLGPDVELFDLTLQETVKFALPRAVRYGLSARFESGSSPVADERVRREPPLVCLTINLDVADSQVAERSDVYGGGLELSVLRMVFLRTGYIKDEDVEIDDATFGFGLGLEAARFQARADYARVPAGGDREDLNRYGVSVGILF
jgi:hypothetical protein